MAKHHHKKSRPSGHSEKQETKGSEGKEKKAPSENLNSGRPPKAQKAPDNAGLASSFAKIPDVGRLIKLDESMFSRLLYPNPVCFLTTVAPSSSKAKAGTNILNVMTLSWLTPANNYGGFAFVIHKSRFSAQNLLDTGVFTLSVAVAAQKDLLLSIGKCSGKSTNKFDGSIPGLSSTPFGVFNAVLAKSEKAEQPQRAASKKRCREDGDGKNAGVGTGSGSSKKNAFSALAGDDDSSSDDEEEENEEEDKEEVKQAVVPEQTEPAAASVSVSVSDAAPSKEVAVAADSVSVPAPAAAETTTSDRPKYGTAATDNIKFPPAISGAVAHMQCRVLSHSDAADAGHHLVVAQVVDASVHHSYWFGGKCLVSELEGTLATNSLPLPPILTFLGSQKFGYVTLETL